MFPFKNMKTACLLFALTLLVLGGFSIIVINFLSVAFGWQDLIVYLVIGVIVYLIVQIIGGSLDKEFNKIVNEFVEGKRRELSASKGLIRTYGLLLITLLPFLLYLYALALFASITFSLYGFILVSNAERVPVGILLGLIIVSVGTLIAILIGIYYLLFPPKRKTIGLVINRNENIRLWNLTKEVAADIKSPPVDKIIITPDAGIGVRLEGNFLSALSSKGERVLELGIPSMYKLNICELRSILAHEYGHFSNHDTHWTVFTYSLGSSLLNTIRSMPGPTEQEDTKNNNESNYVKVIVSLNPAYWLTLIFVTLYFRITNGFSRLCEVLADINAIKMYGGNNFIQGLSKVAINDSIFNEMVENISLELLKEEKVISNISQIMDYVYSKTEKDFIDKKIEQLLQQTPIDTYDSHPPLRTRFDYANKIPSTNITEQVNISSLFDNWDMLNQQIADLYNNRLYEYLKILATLQKQQEVDMKSTEVNIPIKKNASGIKFCPKCNRKFSFTKKLCNYCNVTLIDEV